MSYAPTGATELVMMKQEDRCFKIKNTTQPDGLFGIINYEFILLSGSKDQKMQDDDIFSVPRKILTYSGLHIDKVCALHFCTPFDRTYKAPPLPGLCFACTCRISSVLLKDLQTSRTSLRKKFLV